MVIKYYMMNLNLKFHKDPSFCWQDIMLFVTLYDLEVKILGGFSSWIVANSEISICPLEMVNLILYLIVSIGSLLSDKKKVLKSNIYWPHTNEYCEHYLRSVAPGEY